MRKPVVLIGALLSAAPLFSQTPASAEPRVRNGELLWFDLTESRNDVRHALGQPLLAADFGEDFHAWQYRIGDDVDHDDFSHSLVFRKSTGVLLAVTRNYPEDRNVD